MWWRWRWNLYMDTGSGSKNVCLCRSTDFTPLGMKATGNFSSPSVTLIFSYTSLIETLILAGLWDWRRLMIFCFFFSLSGGSISLACTRVKIGCFCHRRVCDQYCSWRTKSCLGFTGFRDRGCLKNNRLSWWFWNRWQVGLANEVQGVPNYSESPPPPPYTHTHTCTHQIFIACLIGFT